MTAASSTRSRRYLRSAPTGAGAGSFPTTAAAGLLPAGLEHPEAAATASTRTSRFNCIEVALADRAFASNDALGAQALQLGLFEAELRRVHLVVVLTELPTGPPNLAGRSRHARHHAVHVDAFSAILDVNEQLTCLPVRIPLGVRNRLDGDGGQRITSDDFQILVERPC